MWRAAKGWKKAGVALALSGLLLVGNGHAWAAAAETTEDGMWAFREAYLAMKQDDRVFKEMISFFGPAFHANLDMQGQMLRDGSLRLAGKLNFEATEEKKSKTTVVEVPFYVEQLPKDLAFYAQWENQWYKLILPGVPPQLANSLKTTDAKELAANMALVKSVKLLQENDKQRQMDIILDGGKVAEQIIKFSKETMQDVKPEEQQKQQEFLTRLSRVMQKMDVPLSWTVDKETWRTVTVNLNLTELMRAYAQEVLQEAADGKTTVGEEERKILESLGYYSELHMYMTYLGVEAARLEVPQTVKASAQEVVLPKEIQGDDPLATKK
ncbi:hypothetical protein SAMN05216582_13421 [Selenomonas ruminantium]|uniref:DUF2059 domain-containing protein n=1 Tax=Selenomonas ruminantium TaxID=971 RepID=A0A1M6XBR6_SELRU|nr:hypothetical protein [Selenomonas ruminantium]SHL03440.1 hypothetical protein SAMN05216582_13421 [Selenomonas ruminantium]